METKTPPQPTHAGCNATEPPSQEVLTPREGWKRYSRMFHKDVPGQVEYAAYVSGWDDALRWAAKD